MNLSDNFIALIRTSVPLAVGWVVAQLALIGVTLPADSELQLATALTAVAAGLYWAVVSWLSRRWAAVGWLLGNPAQPSYSAPSAPAGSHAAEDADPLDGDAV